MQRIKRATKATIALLAVALTTCAPFNAQATLDLADGFPYAAYHKDCAPWDGPAISLILAADPIDGLLPGYPHLRIANYRPPASFAESSFDWAGTDHTYGHAQLCGAEGECEVPHEVRVGFETPAEDGSVKGEIFIRFVDQREITGRFDAALIQTSMRCG